MIYRLPLLDRMYKEYKGDASAPLDELAEFYKKADGFVIVSGEYNHGIPPALKNLLDHFWEEYFWRPSAIVCYSAGGFGGVRAATQLRMTLSELGMPSIPSILPFARIGSAFSEEGVPHDPATALPTARFLSELEWYARALQAERGAGLAAILAAAWPGPREAITAFHQFVAFGKGLRHIGEPPAYLAGQGTDAGVAQG